MLISELENPLRHTLFTNAHNKQRVDSLNTLGFIEQSCYRKCGEISLLILSHLFKKKSKFSNCL